METKFQVNREKLLTCLEAVSPGLTAKDVTEQSSCFAFKDGWVYTFNDEMSVRCPGALPEDFVGAMPAKPLLELLRSMPDEVLTAAVVADGHRHQLVFAGAGKWKQSGVLLDLEVHLDYKAVDEAKKWLPLPPGFAEAVALVAECAGNDESQFLSTCVHVHPKWIEACDDFQLSRWRIKTGVDKPYLVRHTALRHVAGLGATKFGFGPNWVHFRAKGGLQLSCRCYWDQYPNMSSHFEVDGEPITLPKDLAKAVEAAAIFTDDNPESDHVRVDLKPGKLRLRGVGVYGWYNETRSLSAYNGPAIGFYISPKILSRLVQKYDACVMTADKLKVTHENYRYVTSLVPAESNGAARIEDKGAETVGGG